MKTSKGLVELLERLGIKQNNFMVIVKTSDLIESGYVHLTSGDTVYTCVLRSWLNPLTNSKE